ncbi:SRPBCC domain-containing protein [Streptomyces roseoverticillatus]|uniref:SRPBCC domain-containing protein n=1 Tax=Streptomyces roseoverticillatus TaxID=66429 RepID=UPI001F2C1A1B|nr:SRPBCC domain-containing protein [Streptomyces roseoverticillatus]MCF3106100.1 SRPBCC domain-containing protein [Streptomyces roseoverticillatus]
MADDTITYTTYINATPERVWQGLTDPGLTNRYWGVRFEGDWTTGSQLVWEQGGARIADPEQVVLDSTPHRRLAYTWHTFTPEWAEGVGVGEDLRAELAAGPRTRVAFDVEPVGDVTRLTLVHEGFDPHGVMIGMCGPTWPLLLSSLKTLLETGSPLPEPGAPAQEG